MYTEAKKSTRRTEVVPVVLEKHPNADTLSVVSIFNGGHKCVVKSEDWKGVSLAAYVVPDSVVDTNRPEFSFLKPKANADGTYRVRAMRLRQVWSEGCLVPAPEGSKLGDDVSELLGVTRYEPPEPGSPGNPGLYLGGEVAKSPPGIFIKYDVESFNRYKHVMIEGEPCVIMEKGHGCNSTFLFAEGKMHCRSRTEWKKEYPDYSHVGKEILLSRGLSEEKANEILERLHSKKPKKNLWWQVLEGHECVRKFCEANEGIALVGESLGQVQDLKYGTKSGEVLFFSFDLWDSQEGKFIDWKDAVCLLEKFEVPTMPVLYTGPYSESKVKELTDGKTFVNDADHCREGVVVKPLVERRDEKIGRVIMKSVSNLYLERAR